MIGTSFGRYDIIEELGHGGMSVVYHGVDTGLEREVAIKVLHDHLARKPENRQRLHREAKAIARLRHPNILEVFDYAAEDAERAYIVMEYVEGDNLREFLDRTGVMPAEHGALIGLRLCRALEHAHEHGIIHRDLKPENVMVSTQGHIKLMDFGIAHIFDAETMTQTGSLLGSPAHMAPEMIEGERVDERADIFALGTVLYWLVTGGLPFEGKNAPQILKRVLEGIFKNPEAVEPRVGQCFGDIIRRCLAYELEDRYASVTQVIVDLERFLERAPFEDEAESLGVYLCDPESERERFEAAIVPLLFASAQQALGRNEHTEAFRIFNRILAYEPNHAAVHRAISRLQRRTAAPKIAVCITTAIAAVIAGYFLWGAVDINTTTASPRTISPDSPLIEVLSPAVIQARESASTRATQYAESTTTLARELADSRARALAQSQTWANEAARHNLSQARRVTRAIDEDRRTIAAITSPRKAPDLTPSDPAAVADMGGLLEEDMGARVDEPVRHTYKFRLRPPSAVLSIDGNTYEGHLANKGIALEQGKSYKVLVTCPSGCEPYRTTINVDGPPSQAVKDITLAWRNGIVKIKAPRDSVFYLPGKTRRLVQLTAGKEYHHNVRFGDAASTARPQQELTFVIHDSKQMQSTYERTVTVEPGTTRVINVKF